MTQRFSALKGVVRKVLLEPVTIPSERYYINYDVREVWFRSSRGPTIYKYNYHIGPYPRLIAQFLLEYWVGTQLHRNEGDKEYVTDKVLSLNPRENSILGVTPTITDIELLVINTLVNPLEVYRELLRLQE